MHVEGLLPGNLCIVSLLSLKQCSHFETFCVQLVQMATKPITALSILGKTVLLKTYLLYLTYSDLGLNMS